MAQITIYIVWELSWSGSKVQKEDMQIGGCKSRVVDLKETAENCKLGVSKTLFMNFLGEFYKL